MNTFGVSSINIFTSHTRSYSRSSFRAPLQPHSSLRFRFFVAVPVTKARPLLLAFALTRHSTHSLTMAESSITDSHSNYPYPEYAEIVVVRHGETAWNADGRIQGHLDVELNEAGRQQAAAVADRLSKEPEISVIYSSDLQRAFETARIIASRCGGLEVIKDFDLRERHLGDLQGLIYRDAAKSHPMAHKALASRHEDQEIPGGGESLAQLSQRCTSALQRIGTKHKGERVVVVTHGGFIRSLYRWACPNGRPAGKIHNTSVNVFHFYSDDKWTLKLWGDVSHLHQTEFLQSGFGGDRNSG